ncbi:MAG: BatA domain-containing protein, partial [Pirellulaceae bacterium]|nr:BatA domain-containing protein [Pirellulaceae bacterium]
MQFVHQPLVWGFLLVLVPLLIHLINMLRHRRVKWAAMEFLLQSYKKHRKWVWLKQLLLLLARMAVIALIVGMLAQWITRGQWLDLMGSQTTHHLVLLDDSFSMADQSGGGTAFQTGLDVVRQVATSAATRDTRQTFTLLRFSRAQAAAGAEEARLGQVADLNAETVTTDFDIQLEERRNQLHVTELSVGPRPALELVRQLLGEQTDDQHVVYVVSDFRAKEWANPAELQPVLRELEQAGAELRLVSCVRNERPNLAIVDLKPTDDTRAAGVPLFMNIQIKNFSRQEARKVQLTVRSVAHASGAPASDLETALRGQVEELPTVFVESIKPGEVVTEKVQVYFAAPGQHVVEAVLPDDAVTTDNRRWCVVDFPEGEAVLVIDGSVDQKHAYYLTSTFQPGQRANTGIRPDVKDPAYLRDTSVGELRRYASVYLLDVGRLDQRAVDNLEAYVRGGGGLAILAGDNLNYAAYNDSLYRAGQGLLPLELGGDQLLPPALEESAVDIEVFDNPVFDVFRKQNNSLIRRVRIERYLEPARTWVRDPQSTVSVLAQLRNGSPLAMERTFGEGRVVFILTSLTPDWNNWAQDPSFVVMLLKLQSYLAAGARPVEDRQVATPIEVTLDPAQYAGEVTFVTPDEGLGDRTQFEVAALPPQPEAA